MLGNGEAQKEAIRPDFNRSISVRAPLPGCSWLAVLRVHALRNDCKDLVREVFSKRTKKLDSSRYWNGLMVFWALPKQISALKRENLIEN